MMINCREYEDYIHSIDFGCIGAAVSNPNNEFKQSRNKGFDPTPVKEVHREEELMVKFFFVQNPDGHQIEVFQRYVHDT
jgi:lactoylglutathione lyase